MKSIISTFALFLISLLSFAQTGNKALADKMAKEGEYAKAILLHKKVLAGIPDQHSDAYKEQLYKIQVAKANMASIPQEAAQNYQKAITIFKTMSRQPVHESIKLDLAYSYALIGADSLDAAWKISQSAYQLALKSETEKDSFQEEIAALLKRSAHIKWFQGEYESAISYFKQSLDKYTKLKGYYSVICGDICRFLSTVYSFTPDFNSSMEYGLKAQEIYERVQPDDKYLLFEQYADNFNLIKKYGDIEQASQLIKKIKSYYRANQSDQNFMHGENPNFPNLNDVKTIYYYKLVQYAVAIKDTLSAEKYYRLFQKSIPDEVENFSPMERNSIVKFDLETGYLFHKQTDNFQKAKSYYLHARDFSKSIGYGFGELQAYWILTTLCVDFKQWDDVILYADKALSHPDIDKFNQATTIRHNLACAYYGNGKYDEAFVALADELQTYQNAPKNLNDFVILANCIEIGRIISEISDKKGSEKYLDKAYQAYYLASEIFSRLYRSGKFNDQLASFQNRIAEGLTTCAHRLGKHQAQALMQIEINKSDYLWSHFLQNQPNFKKGKIPLESRLDSLLELKNTIANEINTQPAKQLNKDSLKTEMNMANRQISSVKEKMSESGKPYYQFSKNLFHLNAVQSNLKNNQTAIRYILSDSLAFAYVIRKNDVHLVQLPTYRNQLFSQVQSYLQILKHPKSAYQPLSKSLYNTLISPLGLKKSGLITIITDDFLGYLPFETLQSPDNQWLVEQHPVSYGSSLKLWFIRQNLVAGNKKMLGIFSPKYKPLLASTATDSVLNGLVRSGHYALNGAQKEAQRVHDLFGGDLFVADEASKANFTANASKYNLLHLAMHALLNEEQPHKSSLVFSNNELLPLSELYELEIPAGLAVLSACNTGTGKIKNGEGIQSLSRAFTYAGVKSTVYSLWPVPDKQTTKIMTAFYENLKNGDNKAEALQKAKTTYLKKAKNNALKHPYYWAGFVVSGDIEPIQSNISFWWFLIGGLFLCFLLMFIYRLSFRNGNKPLRKVVLKEA